MTNSDLYSYILQGKSDIFTNFEQTFDKAILPSSKPLKSINKI